MAANRFKPLLDREFLKAELHYQFQDYLASGDDALLQTRLADWSARHVRRETQAEASFMARFFVDTWGYEQAGRAGGECRRFVAGVLIAFLPAAVIGAIAHDFINLLMASGGNASRRGISIGVSTGIGRGWVSKTSGTPCRLARSISTRL